jgi:branched-chain amino acid transport system ATP-binding protein
VTTAEPEWNSAPLLRTTDLSMSFGGLDVLRGLNLEIQPSEIRSIIGPNGAGKTTLFNILSGAFAPTSGTVELNGKDVTGASPDDLHALGLSRSFQVTRVFPDLTVQENVVLARIAAYPRRPGLLWRPRWTRGLTDDAAELLDALELMPLAQRTAGTLSHGDQRRLDIALSMATDPSIILLDEPTAGMARGEAQATMGLLQRLLKGRTIVLIEHDMDLVMRISDRVSMLHYGKLIVTGTPSEVRANPEVRKAYLKGGVN